MSKTSSDQNKTAFVIGTVFIGLVVVVLLFVMGSLGLGVWSLLSQKDYDIDDPEIVQLVEKAPAEVVPVQPPERSSQAIWSLNIPYEVKLNDMGQRLVAVNQIKPAVQFKVLAKQSANQKQQTQWAFSVPVKRTVYFSREALSLIQSDSELACILGHELAHILFNRASIAHIMLKDKQAQDQNYQMEHEADVLGMSLAERAGYHPLGMVYFFKTMTHLEENGKIQYDFSGTAMSHPPDRSRSRVMYYVMRQRFPEWIEKPFEMERSLNDGLMANINEFDSLTQQIEAETKVMLPIRNRLGNYPYANPSDFEAEKARFNQWVPRYNAKVHHQNMVLKEIKRLQDKYHQG